MVQERSPLGCLLVLAGLALSVLGLIGLYYGWRGADHHQAGIRELAHQVWWSSLGSLVLGVALLGAARLAFRAGLTIRTRIDHAGADLGEGL